MRTTLVLFAVVAVLGCRAPGPVISSRAADPNEDRALLYNEASQRAARGDLEGAIAALERLDAEGWSFCPADRDMPGLSAQPRYRELCARMRARAPAVRRATVAMTLPDRKLAPEGIAYEEARRAVFIGSMIERKIVRIDADGSVRDFATRDSGLDSVLGVRVDAAHGLLWAASGAQPVMADYNASDEGRVALFAFDLADGQLRARLTVSGGGPHLLNDVAIGTDGTAYVTDTLGGTVWRGRVGQPGLLPVLPAGTLLYPNGVACDGARLLVAHATGIAAVPIAGGRASQLAAPAGSTIGGLDGLYLHGDTLFGVQNGFGSSRVIRIDLDASRTAARAVTVLESAHPLLETPTTAALIAAERRLLVLVPGDDQPSTVLSVPIDVEPQTEKQ